ncbi:HPP family protein [Streptomyces kanasensis]|uniref:CBS domain-containing protein n=1 Tax=Streptomyces kanasensis TaxID=936756 RepID=UPI003702B0DE
MTAWEAVMTMHAPARDAPGPPARVEVPGPGGEPPPGAGTVPLLDRRVGDVMRAPLVAVAAGETLLVCWELLERTGERHLPVVQPDGRCAGVLDRAEVAAVCAAPAVALSRRYAGDLVRGRRCVVLHERDPVRRAVDVMDDNDCDALPVVADGGTLAGLLTPADVVRALAGRRTAAPPGRAPAPPAPYPVLPGLAPRRDTGRVSPVP